MSKIKYLQLEPAAYSTDPEWLIMNEKERGCYHSLIIYLSSNDGKLEFNVDNFVKICNTNRKTFDKFWLKYRTKFIEKNGSISHKRVTRELAKARKLLRQRKLAGKASANARSTLAQRSSNSRTISRSTKGREGNESEGKEREDKTKRNEPSVSDKKSLTSSLRFAEKVEKIITPRTKSDRTAFVNLCQWLHRKINNKQFDEDIYETILAYADQAKSGRKPIAVFFATLRRELRYQGQG